MSSNENRCLQSADTHLMQRGSENEPDNELITIELADQMVHIYTCLCTYSIISTTMSKWDSETLLCSWLRGWKLTPATGKKKDYHF